MRSFMCRSLACGASETFKRLWIIETKERAPCIDALGIQCGGWGTTARCRSQLAARRMITRQRFEELARSQHGASALSSISQYGTIT